MSSNDLFDLRNFFYLGNYQAAINEGQSLPSSTLSEYDATEKDCYVFRSYIAKGNLEFVLQEIPDSTKSIPLLAVKLLATYIGKEESREIAVATLKEWLQDSAAASHPTVQIIGATIFYLEGNYEEAMRCVFQSTSLEGLAFLVQIYLTIHRVDQAEKELKGMQQLDADATPTQLATAWVYLALGGQKISEAEAIFQELGEKYGFSSLLLNGMAICAMHEQNFNQAEKYLLQALEKNSSDPDTLANLVVCYQHQQKPTEIINRQINQLKLTAPNHKWLSSLSQVEQQFDQLALQFGMK